MLQHQPLLDVFHDYADKPVRLEVREVTQFSGEPTPLEGQPMRWVPRAQLVDYEFPRANVAIVECLLNDAAFEASRASDD